MFLFIFFILNWSGANDLVPDSGQLQINYKGFCRSNFVKGQELVSLKSDYSVRSALGYTVFDSNGKKTRSQSSKFDQKTKLNVSEQNSDKSKAQIPMNQANFILTTASEPSASGLSFKSLQISLLRDEITQISADLVVTADWENLSDKSGAGTWKSILKKAENTLVIDPIFKAPDKEFCYLLKNNSNGSINCNDIDVKKICAEKKEGSFYLIYSLTYKPDAPSKDYRIEEATNKGHTVSE